MFEMDGDQDNQSSAQDTSTLAAGGLAPPPGLGASPVVPAAQPFNMFANQQVSTWPSIK